MDYAPWYDEHAAVVDLNPGEMLHWPLNSPHRVDNHDCLNVSMTTEYWTDPIRRNVMMNCGNAVLRHKLGITPRSHSLERAGLLAQGSAAGRRQALRDAEAAARSGEANHLQARSGQARRGHQYRPGRRIATDVGQAHHSCAKLLRRRPC